MNRLVSITCAALLAHSAQAADFPVSVSGSLSFGATDRQPGADVFLSGDGTIRLEYGRFGLELGSYGYLNALDSPHETYGALTWDSDLGRLSAGVPRPAYDSFAPSALERDFPTLAADRSARTRSEATWGAMYAGHLPLGVRLEGARRGFRFAISAHHAANADVSLIGIGLERDTGDWTLSAAIEARQEGSARLGGKAQAAWHNGPARAGFGLYAPAFPGRSVTAEGFASYMVFDWMTVSGVIQTDLDGDAPVLALSGRYDVSDWAAVSTGAALVDGEPVLNTMISLEF